ncbi:MAG: apolipoprotein N-acyltransferase [Gammaproteobacteria bacterium]|nr:apolipoprotein N-acyltransferase [Gammaproteobacteria bacterium]
MSHIPETQSHKIINLISGIKGDAVALTAGVLAVFSFAPFDIFPLSFLALFLLFISWSGITPGRAFRRGFLFGTGMFGVGVYWVHISIHEFGNTGFIPAVLLTFLLVMYMACYPALLGYVFARFCKQASGLSPVFFLASGWALIEWMRAWIMTGFPWLNLGYAQLNSWLAGYAPVIGVYGVGFIIAMTGALLAGLLWGNKKQNITSLILLVTIWLGGFVLNMQSWSTPDGEPIKVAMLQGNIGQEMKWRPEKRQATFKLYEELTLNNLDQDLIIWPETAIPALYHQVADQYLERIRQVAQKTNTDLLIGVPYLDQGTQKYYNSMVALGEITDFYHKRHLVPFGEFIPFKSVIGSVLDILQIPMSDFSSGEQDKPILTIANNKAGISICYEDAFGEEVIDALPEATLLVNVSNDAWFGDSLAPHQHLQIARMRALETARPMLRATNTGISAIIDERGNITSTSPQFKLHVLKSTVQPMQGETPYVKWGNWFIIILSLALLGLIRLREK